MPYVVTDECVKCKHTSCVGVCPVECFHEGPNFLVIDPEECIDCGACEPECPIQAIVPRDALPEAQRELSALNEQLAKVWPSITDVKEPLPDHRAWARVPGKLKLLER